MKKYILSFVFALGIAGISKAQVAIGTSTPDASAKFQIDATDKGVLLPRLSQAQMNAIATPATGLMLYCTDCAPVGYRNYNGTSWVPMVPVPTLNEQTGIVLTATTTAPSTGTRYTDQILWEECGNKVKLKYNLAIAGGQGGSGNYLFQLPNGVQFNTSASRNPIFTGVAWANGAAQTVRYFIPASGAVVFSQNWSQELFVVPYSATTFRVFSTHNGSGFLSVWGSDFFATSAGDIAYTFEFEIWK